MIPVHFGEAYKEEVLENRVPWGEKGTMGKGGNYDKGIGGPSRFTSRAMECKAVTQTAIRVIAQ